MTLDVEETAPDTCPTCGRPREEWTENEGLGVISGGVTYCSAECGLKDAAQQQQD